MAELALFPSKIATGASFCNREKERKLLAMNLQQGRHTLIVSPRRYGKTSLATKVIDESGLPFVTINLFNAFQDEVIAQKFMKGLSNLVSQLTSASEKFLKKLGSLVSNMTVSFVSTGVQMTVHLEPLAKSPLEKIETLLENLEKILADNAQKVVIFLDEFQDISKADLSHPLQALLRDFAQKTQYVSLVISGSHRHLLSEIFDDRNKPFYKLCDRINLEKIKAQDHRAFIQKYAKQKWNNPLPEEAISLILNLTENHPYYVNRLCAKLWFEDVLPSAESVNSAWTELGKEEFDSVVNDIKLLNKNQRILLQVIAKKGALTQHSSHAVVQEVQMPASTIVETLRTLVKQDFIETIPEGGYRVIDPLIRYTLAEETP